MLIIRILIHIATVVINEVAGQNRLWVDKNHQLLSNQLSSHWLVERYNSLLKSFYTQLESLIKAVI
jgi:hypothetical protein